MEQQSDPTKVAQEPTKRSQDTTTTIEPVPYKRPKRYGRITVVNHMYHQSAVGQHFPQAGRQGFTRVVASEVQPYYRQRVIKNIWEPLDFGWVREVGYIHIENSMPQPRMISDLEAIPDNCIELRTCNFGSGGIRIRPGEHIDLEPIGPELWQIRACGAAANIEITVYPR